MPMSSIKCRMAECYSSHSASRSLVTSSSPATGQSCNLYVRGRSQLKAQSIMKSFVTLSWLLSVLVLSCTGTPLKSLIGQLVKDSVPQQLGQISPGRASTEVKQFDGGIFKYLSLGQLSELLGHHHSVVVPPKFPSVNLVCCPSYNPCQQNAQCVCCQKPTPVMNNNLQEPYKFDYLVSKPEKNVLFGHKEVANAQNARKGSYFVLLPNGKLQTVNYVADKTGYHAKVHHEQVIPPFGDGKPAPAPAPAPVVACLSIYC